MGDGNDTPDSSAGDTLKSEIIPDFYKEIIGRIIPGLVVIVILAYWSAVQISKDFPWGIMSVLLLIIAWIIGIILDEGVYVICKCARITKTKFFGESNEAENFKRHLEVYNEVSALKIWERQIFGKREAMVIFHRSMLEISIFTTVLSLITLIWGTPWFPNLFDNPIPFLIFGVILAVTFSLCWHYTRKGHRASQDALIDRLKLKFPKAGRHG